MLFNLFKKKVEPIRLQQIIVKRKGNKNIYVGQIVSIEGDIGTDSIKYTLNSYQEGCISNKITKEYEELCEKYRYAIIKDFNDEKIDARVICYDGYLQRLKVKLNDNFDNGNSFIIKEDTLYDNGKIIGKIVDNKYDSNSNIAFNELDNDRLVVFIRK